MVKEFIYPAESNKSAGMSHFTKTDINELSSLPDVAVVEYSLPTEEIRNNKSGQNSSRTPTRINQDESPDVNK